MRSLPRPPILVALSVALAVGAAVVAFRQGAPNRLAARPVAAGDREIAWLDGATNVASWERFVAGVVRAADRLRADDPGLECQVGPEAFPAETTATPEIALAWPAEGRRLVFRWYKLTSDWKTGDWTNALAHRDPPPLAVVGGDTSDAGRELALHLREDFATIRSELRPLLILTTATADRVAEQGRRPSVLEMDGASQVPLVGIYPGRTFRFCFTNRQMADAVVQFIWNHDDLRPDADPVRMVRWHDDSYSPDLLDGFSAALQKMAVREGSRDFLWLAGSNFRLLRDAPSQLIDSSVGTFLSPNRFEEKAAANILLDIKAETVTQERPLLAVTGQTQPSRRFLRALARRAPDQARRFVVVTGDAPAFNTVYRDRRITWPIQDLPFKLVFFSHYNPIDPEAGFRPHGEPDEGDGAAEATGTEDVLLNSDIVEALVRGSRKDGDLALTAAQLGERFTELRQVDGRLGFHPGGKPLFAPDGNRRSGAGEHVICLRPRIEGDRVWPEATLEVWAWLPGPDGHRQWQRRGEPLVAYYGDSPPEGSP